MSKFGDCWIWEGARDKDGYGRVRWKYRMMRAHVAAWECEHNRAVPKNGFIMHTCDNPSCVNPSHLKLGSPSDNAKDRDFNGRGGHNPMAGDNGRRARRDKFGKFVSMN